MQSQKRGVLTSKSGSATDQRQPSITISHNPIPITTSTTPPKKINPTPLPNANLISSLYANQPTLPQPQSQQQQLNKGSKYQTNSQYSNSLFIDNMPVHTAHFKPSLYRPNSSNNTANQDSLGSKYTDYIPPPPQQFLNNLPPRNTYPTYTQPNIVSTKTYIPQHFVNQIPLLEPQLSNHSEEMQLMQVEYHRLYDVYIDEQKHSEQLTSELQTLQHHYKQLSMRLQQVQSQGQQQSSQTQYPQPQIQYIQHRKTIDRNALNQLFQQKCNNLFSKILNNRHNQINNRLHNLYQQFTTQLSHNLTNLTQTTATINKQYIRN